jgi:hypothetical protein
LNHGIRFARPESCQDIFPESKDLCGPALSVISTVGGRSSEVILAESLNNDDLMTMMVQICKLVMKKCDDNITNQNKITALEIYVSFHAIAAMSDLNKAASHPNEKYRNTALKISLTIPGTEVVRRWIDFPQWTC